ncbi:unnamed protein product [Alopecurus aequalis]
MAAGCGGKHTRFPFLETVRYLVATVVTALVVSVVVMVIVVVHRPVEIAFSSDGYIEAEKWWRNVTSLALTSTDNIAASLGSSAYGPAGVVAQSPANGPAGVVAQSPANGPAVAHSTVYEPAEKVDILLALSAVNPSGRSHIMGSIDKIHVIDILNRVEICYFEPTKFGVNSSVNFDLPPQIRHRYRRWVTIWENEQLQYLYDNHLHDAGGFSVLLVVDTKYGPKGGSMKILSYYCSPVTFVNIGMSTEEQDFDVTCKTARDMGYEANFNSTNPCNASMS